MYTNITRLTLEKAILEEHDLHNMFSLVADKLRVIWTALGWTHMTEQFGKADEIVENLTQNVLEGLMSEEEEISWGTAGLTVRGYWDEENLMLDYSFNL